jgi:hypothetical protein
MFGKQFGHSGSVRIGAVSVRAAGRVSHRVAHRTLRNIRPSNDSPARCLRYVTA